MSLLWTLLLSNLLAVSISSPIYAPQFLSGGTGRNIRHLPCVSRSTGETGVCMFAYTCVKLNGTHLGTCIDRFYFGSCCKLNEDAEVHPQDNTIEDASSGGPFTSTGTVPESNDIPTYLDHSEKKPEASSSTIGSSGSTSKIQQTTTRLTTTTTTTTTTATSTRRPPTTTQRIVTKRPERPTFFSTPYTTTQPPIGLSTFQTLHDYSHTVTSSPSTNRRPTTTVRPSTVIQKNSTLGQSTTTAVASTSSESSSSPSGSSTTVIRKPTVSSTKRPAATSTTKPSTRRPTTTETTTRATISAVSSTTERTSTRFPPRNATTTKPTTAKKPAQSGTKKPTSTSKRPVSTRRPTTESPTSSTGTKIKPITSTQETPTSSFGKPSSTGSSARPSSTSTSAKPLSSIVTTSSQKLTTTPATSSSQEKVTTTPKPSSRPGTTSGRPGSTSGRPGTTSGRPGTTSGRPGTTSGRPGTTSGRPRPTSKPTKTSVTTTQRPTTTRTTTKSPPTSTQKIKPSSSSETSSTTFSSTYTKPPSQKPSATPSSRPKPTEKPLKPSKPSKPSKPITTTQPTTTTTASTTQGQTLSVTSSIINETTLANEILPPKISGPASTTETIVQTSQPPGLVTWSSNSDDDVTKAPQVPSTTSITTQEAATEPEWSPITTPDGWIMIQSPTTEKTQISSEDAPRPETTKIPTTSERPASESATTERVTSARPTIPAMLSTIATVTVATDLPVPIETLNMSDYTQVCGRRLFPESRIVGGDHSSFGKWPWQISLRQWRTAAYLHKCGAALLNENWAITAAHCVENVPPSDLLLRIGEHDLANEDEPYGFQERRVQIVASHPQFDPRTFEYDLALLRFYEPVLPFQPNLLPICLPDDDENYVGHTAYVTGWGRLYEDGPLPSVLQEVSVPVVNNSVCEGMYRNAGYIEHIPHIFICAGWRKGGFDSCEGDSGGPMVIRRPRDKRWILAGVISWGIGCAEPNQPGVYTRISEFREWINQILQF